jgi:hypothetical protein
MPRKKSKLGVARAFAILLIDELDVMRWQETAQERLHRSGFEEIVNFYQ